MQDLQLDLAPLPFGQRVQALLAQELAHPLSVHVDVLQPLHPSHVAREVICVLWGESGEQKVGNQRLLPATYVTLNLLGTETSHVIVVEDPLVGREEAEGHYESLYLPVDGQQTKLLIAQSQEDVSDEGREEVVQDDIYAEPERGGTEVEAVHPDAPLRWIYLVHLSHVRVNHGPRDGIVSGGGAVVDFRPERRLVQLVVFLFSSYRFRVVGKGGDGKVQISRVAGTIPCGGQNGIRHKVSGHNVPDIFLPQVQSAQYSQATRHQDPIQSV